MTTLIEQVENLKAALTLPRETLIRDLQKPVKGSWALRDDALRDNSAFMEGCWDFDERGRLVEL